MSARRIFKSQFWAKASRVQPENSVCFYDKETDEITDVKREEDFIELKLLSVSEFSGFITEFKGQKKKEIPESVLKGETWYKKFVSYMSKSPLKREWLEFFSEKLYSKLHSWASDNNLNDEVFLVSDDEIGKEHTINPATKVLPKNGKQSNFEEYRKKVLHVLTQMSEEEFLSSIRLSNSLVYKHFYAE